MLDYKVFIHSSRQTSKLDPWYDYFSFIIVPSRVVTSDPHSMNCRLNGDSIGIFVKLLNFVT